jgi:hypothetical protein
MSGCIYNHYNMFMRRMMLTSRFWFSEAVQTISGILFSIQATNPQPLPITHQVDTQDLSLLLHLNQAVSAQSLTISPILGVSLRSLLHSERFLRIQRSTEASKNKFSHPSLLKYIIKSPLILLMLSSMEEGIY